MIIHLNGWPGVGKKTIGTALSRKLDARFIHNHLLHDVAIVFAGFDGESEPCRTCGKSSAPDETTVLAGR